MAPGQGDNGAFLCCMSAVSMLVHPQFDRVAFSIGPVDVHWYGLSYLVAFGLFWLLATHRIKQTQFASAGWQRRDVEDMLFYGVLGVVIGGRLGSVLFYNLDHYLANPLDAFKVWKGGMAFHGGLLGVITAMWLWGRSRKPQPRPFLQVMDVVAPCVPTGIAVVRFANFVNGELWGRPAPATLPWAMQFPQSGSLVPRHPSQLYQMLLEGLLLFVLLWWYAQKQRRRGQVASAFVFGYGVLRFVAEYFREPDRNLGLLALGMSMGQWLCLPMIALGAFLWWWCGKTQPEAKA
jgi:phosphatidylglycerol---prolipoprotein diacylglyceryl transferase